MLLFHRLLLAHVIADFPLQTTELVRWKQHSPYGVVVHCLIVAVTSSLLLLPDMNRFWPGVLALTLVHVLTDQGKIALARRRPHSDNVFSFLADQLVHIVALAVVSLAYHEHEPTAFGGDLALLREYGHLFDVPHIVFLTCVIASAFGGTYLVLFLARTYSPEGNDSRVSYAQELLGVVERGGVTALVAVGTPAAWVAAAAVIALKASAGFKLHTNAQGRRNFITFDVLFSATIAIVLGLLAQIYGS